MLTIEPRGYSEEEKDLVYRAYRERRSKRAVSRIFAVSRNTLNRWLEKRDEKWAQWPMGSGQWGRTTSSSSTLVPLASSGGTHTDIYLKDGRF